MKFPSNLTTLDLSNNPLTNISSDTFINLTQLNKLSLKNTQNNLNIIKFPLSLEYLYISGNSISNLNLTYLAQLKTLDASKTNLASFDQIDLPSCIEILDLSNIYLAMTSHVL